MKILFRLIPWFLALSACGSRSSLLSDGVGAAEGGAGAASAGGSGGFTTAVGGAGGGAGATTTGTFAPKSCESLVVSGEPLSPEAAQPGMKQAVPWLSRTEPSGAAAALVYHEDQDIGDDGTIIGSVVIADPWGEWPAGLGTTAHHLTSYPFVAGPGANGRFSALTDDMPNGASVATGMIAWSPTAGVPAAEGQYFDELGPGAPAFVTSNGGDLLAGVLPDGQNHLSLARLALAEPTGSFAGSVACAKGATLSGAAIPLAKDYLVAISNGRPFGTCLNDDLTDGPPTRLQVVRLQGTPSSGLLTYELEKLGTFVFQTRLVEAPTGAWVAWERVPFEPPFDRDLVLLELDGEGFPASGKTIEIAFGTLSSPIAVAPLGASVAVGTTRDSPGGGRVLDVNVITPDGGALGSITLTAGDGFELDTSVSLLASPFGDQLLVAWGESSAIDNDDRRVRVARLACAGP